MLGSDVRPLRCWSNLLPLHSGLEPEAPELDDTVLVLEITRIHEVRPKPDLDDRQCASWRIDGLDLNVIMIKVQEIAVVADLDHDPAPHKA